MKTKVKDFLKYVFTALKVFIIADFLNLFRRLQKHKFILSNAKVCIWNTGGDCKGKIYEAKMFNQQITIPTCSKHLYDHRVIMSLHKAEQDVEKVVKAERSKRNKMMRGVKLVPWNEV